MQLPFHQWQHDHNRSPSSGFLGKRMGIEYCNATTIIINWKLRERSDQGIHGFVIEKVDLRVRFARWQAALRFNKRTLDNRQRAVGITVGGTGASSAAIVTGGRDLIFGLQSMIMDNDSERDDAEKGVRFVLMDRTGPLAEFDTWEDAYECMASHRVHGASIVRWEKPMGEATHSLNGLGTDQEFAVGNAAGARGQTGRAALGKTAGLEGLMPVSGPTAPAAGKKVLVIEDDVSALLAIAQVVKSAGHNPIIARNAAEGVEIIGLERPELIIVDIDPTGSASGRGWAGLQLLEWLQCHHPDHRAKYIAVSTADVEALKLLTPGVGSFACVRKPLVKESMLAEITRAIGGPSELDLPQGSQPRPG